MDPRLRLALIEHATREIQLAVAAGAHVTAVDTAGKLGTALSLGAQEVLEAADDVTRSGRRFDVVIDVPGNQPFSAWRQVLHSKGRYVLVGHDDYGCTGSATVGGRVPALRLVAMSPFRSQLTGLQGSRDRGDRFAELDRLARSGAVAPQIDRTFPLEDVMRAFEHLM